MESLELSAADADDGEFARLPPKPAMGSSIIMLMSLRPPESRQQSRREGKEIREESHLPRQNPIQSQWEQPLCLILKRSSYCLYHREHTGWKFPNL